MSIRESMLGFRDMVCVIRLGFNQGSGTATNFDEGENLAQPWLL